VRQNVADETVRAPCAGCQWQQHETDRFPELVETIIPLHALHHTAGVSVTQQLGRRTFDQAVAGSHIPAGALSSHQVDSAFHPSGLSVRVRGHQTLQMTAYGNSFCQKL